MPSISTSALSFGSGNVGNILYSPELDSKNLDSFRYSNSYDSIENYSPTSSLHQHIISSPKYSDDDIELDRHEIRKILIRTLPPLPKAPSPYKRLLDNRIVEIINESIPIRKNFDGNIKQYYDLNLIIPPSLLEFVQGFEWNPEKKFLNPNLNIISGPIQFSKLDSLDLICRYPALQQVYDINSIVFIAVGKDILGVRVSDVETKPSNFNLHIFREGAENVEMKTLFDVIEGFSCWNIDRR